jgi:hypothetical protein
LQHKRERCIGTEPCRYGVGTLLVHHVRDVEELQARLARKEVKRLLERLRGDIGGEHRGCDGLSCGDGDPSERDWRAY